MKVLTWLHSRAARRANYGLLLVAMLLVIVGYPVLEDLGIHAPKLLSGFFMIVLLACLAAAIEQTAVLAVFLFAVLLLELSAGLLDIGGPGAHSAVQFTARAVVLLFTAGVLLRDVMRASSVGTITILGAVCVYLLLGLVGSDVYALILSLDPGAFSLPDRMVEGADGARVSLSQTLYYSFVTMTTLGFGDITPVSGAARAVSTLQAVVGQFYIAVVVARLVALQVSNADARRRLNAIRKSVEVAKADQAEGTRKPEPG
jgi:hypothetical protein